MAGPKRLSARIRSKYDREGAGAVLRSLPRTVVIAATDSIRVTQTKLVYRTLQNDLVTRDALRRRMDADGCLWIYGESERVTIDHDPSRFLVDPFHSYTGIFDYPQPFLSKISDPKLLWEGGAGAAGY